MGGRALSKTCIRCCRDLRDPTVPMPSIKDFVCGGERRVPRAPLPSMSPLDAWAKKPQSGLRVTWLGHSTMLIEIDGVRILTDPVWGPRASPSTLVGPKRFQPVPIVASRHAAGRCGHRLP